MSDAIDADVSTSVSSPRPGGNFQSNPPVISALDLLRIAHGFSFAFWGLLVMLLSLVQVMIAITPRNFEFFLLGFGLFGVVGGAWRLRQARGLTLAWRRRALALLLTAIAMAYLFPFFWMWRRLPSNVYFLAHALLFAGAFIYYAASICWSIAELGKIRQRRSFVIQSILVGLGMLLLVLIPFFVSAQRLITIARRGVDPVSVIQLLLQRTGLWIPLLLFLPLSLTLSLLWAAKDAALDELAMRARPAEAP